MPKLRFPLVGSYMNRNIDPANFTAKDQQFINCYPEVTKNPITGSSRVYLNKRPGYTTTGPFSGATSSSAVGALVAWTGNSGPQPPIAAAFRNGTTSTSVFDISSGSQIGAAIPTTSDCTCLTETMVSGTAHLVGNFLNSTTASTERWYFPEGGSWTKVTSATFPANVVGFPAHMDGYVFDMTQDGNIWNSDLNSVSVYTPANFTPANLYPDKGVTVARYNQYIVGFGEKSIEFFKNSGGAGLSPLSRLDGLQMGAARRSSTSHHTVMPGHGTIYWMATNSEGASIGVYRFNGLSPEKISSPAIDKLLATTQFMGFIGTLFLHGMRHIALQGTAGVWCYCLETNYWWQWTLASGEPTACIGASDVAPGPYGVTYFLSGANAVRSLISATAPVYLDDGANYTMTVGTQEIDADTDKKKYWKKMRIVGDVQTSTSNVGVSWSDDDFTTYTTAVNVDMSSTQNYITRLGASRRRSWKFTHATSTPMRIESVELEYDMGST